jgi:hypothetical protein
MTPELAWMNLAMRINTGKLPTCRTAAVTNKKLMNLFEPVRVVFLDVSLYHNAIRMVICREKLHGNAPSVPIERFIHQTLNHLPSLFFRKVLRHKVFTSPRVNKMIQTEPGYVLSFHNAKYAIEIRYVLFCDCKPDTAFKTDISTVPQPVERLLERTTIAPEPVVSFLKPVETYPDILEPGITSPQSNVTHNKRPI